MVILKTLRDRTWLFLNSDIAAAAGMSLAQLQQFGAGAFTPAPAQIEQLARRIGVKR